MNSEGQFKDSLKKLLDSKDFPFDEDNWDKAMLVRDAEKSRRRLLPFLIAAVLLITGGMISYFYFITSGETAVAEHAAIPANTPTHAKAPAAEASGNTITLNKSLPTNPTTQQKHKHTADQPKEPAVQPKNTAGAPVVAVNATPVAATVKQPKSDPAVKNNDGAPANEPVALQDQKTIAAHTILPPIQNTDTQPLETTTTTDGTVDDKLLAVQPSEAIAAKEEKVDETNSSANTAGLPKAEAPALKPGAETPVLKNADANNTEQLTSINSPDAVATTTAAVSNTSTAAKADSTANTAAIPEVPPSNPKIIMCFEAGASFLTGWNNPGKRDAQGLNPVFGINYYNYLTPQLAVSFGAQYTTVNSLNYASHISRVTRYNLGEESDVTVITPQKVHYLMVPIRLHYSVNAKNTFGAGFNVAYMLTIDSKMEKYHERLDVRENYKASETQGYTEGFKAFDTQLSVFYRRKVYKGLSVHAEYMFGLTDIKDNTFFNSHVFERNTGFKLTLMYNLFK